MMAQIGRILAVLHDGGLIHGDLTTSNMLVRDSDGAVVSTLLLRDSPRLYDGTGC